MCLMLVTRAGERFSRLINVNSRPAAAAFLAIALLIVGGAWPYGSVARAEQPAVVNPSPAKTSTVTPESVKPVTVDDGQLALLKTFMAEFVEITPGQGQFPQSFIQGTSTGSPSESPAREVKMERSFWMAKYEVPQNLYLAVSGENPSRWKGPRNSAEMFSYAEAVNFCDRATAMLHSAKLLPTEECIRLPSEAEWEYCCRAGSATRYSFGDEARTANDAERKASLLDPYCWHTGNAAGNDPPVGALKPNAWDLYDMHGYLWEFVQAPRQDTTEPARLLEEQTGAAKPRDEGHIIRGGGWTSTFDLCTSTSRLAVSSETRRPDLGFRCVRARVVK